MVSKESYIKEIDSIKISESVKEKLMYLYDCYLGKQTCKFLKNEIKLVLEEMLKNDFSKEILIPYKFLESSIGIVLFTLQFKGVEKIYNTKDLIELSGYSKQYIHQQIRDKAIVSHKDSNGNYFFDESEVMSYLKQKGKLKEGL